MENQKLFRNASGELKPLLDHLEGITFRDSPLDFFILLARYKFAGRLLRKTDHVLDAGCGHGLGSVMLASFASKVTGADFDAELVAHCNKEFADNPRLDFVQADLRDLSAHPAKYDAIVCMDVIEHFSLETAGQVLQSLVSVLNPNGILIMGTPNAQSGDFASERRKLSHPHEFDHAGFDALLRTQFERPLIFSMTDETVSTAFPKLAWYFMAVCQR